jgi:flagellar L-ring protein precursor FlgH
MNFKKIQKLILLASLSIATLNLISCASPVPQRMEKFSYEPSYPLNMPNRAQPKDGSLYLSGTNRSLFNDSTAHLVGDIITINLDETFDANKNDRAQYDKSNTQDIGVTNPLNIFGKNASELTGGAVSSLGVGVGSNSAFDGQSQVQQNSRISGSIAVTVVEVISNGNLVIRGEKWITVHDGEEVIRFAGIIRPQDILQDNTIASDKVADVRLIYQDLGISGDTARAGGLTKLINRFSPF